MQAGEEFRDRGASLNDNRVRALKSLAGLIVRELELIEESGAKIVTAMTQENISFSEKVKRFETVLIRFALMQSHGHQRRAAELLGIKVTTLNTKIKRYGIASHYVGGVWEPVVEENAGSDKI